MYVFEGTDYSAEPTAADKKAFDDLIAGRFNYEGCSNMNASGFITFFPYMLRQNGKHFYKGLYVTFKMAPDQKKNTVYLSS